MSRVVVRGRSTTAVAKKSKPAVRTHTRPPTEWERKSPEERAAILNAPFPPIDRHSGKTWAGVIVVDDMDDPLTLVYKQPNVAESGDGSIDNLFRSLEG